MENRYQAPASDVTQVNDELEYAGFWIRVLASLIDTVWVSALTLSLGWMVYGIVYFESTEFSQGYADLFITYFLPFVITILFWLYKAATPGKMAVKIKIVDEKTLGAATKGQLILRYLGYYVSLFALGLGYFWIGWDARKQGWHDKMAKTLVIKRA